jgi:tetratricopeptide (TPR) repeat protein
LGTFTIRAVRTRSPVSPFWTRSELFPTIIRPTRGLGKVLAASGDVKGAIENYLRAQQITPLPDYASALYDLYKGAGDEARAAKQMDLLDLIDKVSQANGEKANRNLVFAFADHNVRLDRALELAQGELQFRRDIYSYDALAWALYRNHRYPEAKEAMAQALKLGTPEPQFKLHAQVIEEAMKENAQ